jgi:hypothetical protein
MIVSFLIPFVKLIKRIITAFNREVRPRQIQLCNIVFPVETGIHKTSTPWNYGLLEMTGKS